MRTLILGVLAIVVSLQLEAQEKPKIIIGIVVDQMRHDYLQRFQSKFSENGFKRMIRDGFEARNTHYNYVPTYTGPGHASVYTGTTPKYHGIIGNDWYDRNFQKPIYCVEDSMVTHVGGSPSGGRISPRNLLTTTITDELILASNFKAKVVGIALKDRGAVLPAGHHPAGAYWYDSKTGQFMTSSFYGAELPEWLIKFNKQNYAELYSNKTWSTLLPIEAYTESTSDLSPYERGFKGKDTPTFPYKLQELRQHDRFGLIRSTPFGNTLILDLAKAAIEGEELGKGTTTDFLAMSFSSPDYIGHNFGTHSIEVEDTYLRLDQELGEFLIYLDMRFGKNNYLVFLTADHAVVENPQFLMDSGMPGGYLKVEDANKALLSYLKNTFGEGAWIEDVSNDQVFLNRTLIAEKGLNLPEVQSKVAAMLLKIEGVSEVYTATDMARLDYSEPRISAMQRGYNSRMSGDLLVLQKPGYLPDNYGTKGTSHGTGYSYDTHVPLLFFGAGVKKGATVRNISITDIAPTLSFLMDISLPNACTGQPIIELFE